MKEPTGTALKRRERQILTFYANGMLVKEVAFMMDASPRTIEGVTARIKKKLGARTVAQACAIGVRRGIIVDAKEWNDDRNAA